MAGILDFLTSDASAAEVGTPGFKVDPWGATPKNNLDLVSQIMGFGKAEPVMAAAAQGSSPWTWDRFFGTKSTPGWGGMALGALQGLGSAYMGMKQYGLMEDSLKQNQAQFEKNYAAQRQMVNSQLEDRQRARLASNSGAYESLGSYMDRNRIV